jgi:hypothetical protein
MRLTAVLIVFQLSRKGYLAVLFEWNFFSQGEHHHQRCRYKLLNWLFPNFLRINQITRLNRPTMKSSRLNKCIGNTEFTLITLAGCEQAKSDNRIIKSCDRRLLINVGLFQSGPGRGFGTVRRRRKPIQSKASKYVRTLNSAHIFNKS